LDSRGNVTIGEGIHATGRNVAIPDNLKSAMMVQLTNKQTNTTETFTIVKK
jgi:hypothetical protein